jgi:hypothetical protein
MPVTGRINKTKPSIVRNPPQPTIPIYFGSLNLGLSFEGHPSASFSYEGVREVDIARYENTYVPNVTQVVLNNNITPFVVMSFGFDRERHPSKQQPFATYKVSIALKSLYELRSAKPIKVFSVASRNSPYVSLSALCRAAQIPYIGPNINIPIPPNSDANLTISVQDAVNAHLRINGCYVSWTNGCHFKNFDSGAANWTFATPDVIVDGQNTRSGWNGYRDTELTWGKSKDSPESTTPTNGTQLVRKEPQIETIVEGDEDYASPPPNTFILKDLSSTCDESSPPKTVKKTTTINGTPEREIIEIYKFCYIASDIWTGDMLFSSNPGQFWKLVERQETQHIYESLPATTFTVRAKDPNPKYAQSSVAGFVNLIIHPDYAHLVSGSALGGTVTFQNTTQYLTQIQTTTTKLVRLAKEAEGGEVGYASIDEENPYYNLVRYKKVTGQQIQAYLLKSTRKEYGTDVGSPFSVEWRKYDELEERFKRLVATQNITSSGMVGILTPDPAFKEPMFIKTESKVVNTFLWAANPNSAPPDDYKAPLTTGEESYYQVDRTIGSANKYRERVTNSSFQDSGFLTSAEHANFKEVIGRPPEASTRDTQWEKQEVPPDRWVTFGKPKAGKTKKYLLTSDLLTEFTAIESSKSYPEAATFQQALNAAILDLRIKDLQACQSSKKVSWYYPNVRDGDVVSVGSDRFAKFGRERVLGVSWTLNYSGVSTNHGLSPICLCDGTSLTLGIDHNRAVDYRIEEVEDAGAGDGASGEPKLETTGGGTSNTLGMIATKGQSRRQF